MEIKKIDGEAAGFLFAGVMASLFLDRTFLQNGKYIDFAIQTLAITIGIFMCWALGFSIYKAFVGKKEATPKNRIIFWVGYFSAIILLCWYCGIS